MGSATMTTKRKRSSGDPDDAREFVIVGEITTGETGKAILLEYAASGTTYLTTVTKMGPPIDDDGGRIPGRRWTKQKEALERSQRDKQQQKQNKRTYPK